MTEIEIYWDDLKPEKQQEILEVLGDNGNYDVIPIATLEFETDMEEGVLLQEDQPLPPLPKRSW